MMDYRKLNKRNAVFVLLIALLLVGCQQQPEEQEIFGEALGTSYQVKFFSPEDLQIERSLDSVFEVINSSLSTYRTDSDISRINAGDTSVKVDEHFRNVFEASKKIHRESEGHFDPTVGNLVNAYGFGSDSGLDSLTSIEIDSILQYVGFDKVILTKDNRVVKEEPEIYLEFNAIAKGYAVDVIGEFLDKKKVENYLVEVGGELVAKGKNLEKDSFWVVAIDDPLQTVGDRTLQASLYLKDQAMATSGNYRKYREDTLTGEHYVHTINPLTGQAEKSDLLSVSVLAENCTLADAYATAFMALGFERSKEMLEKLQNVDVYFIYAEDADEVEIEADVNVYTSKGFEEALLEEF